MPNDRNIQGTDQMCGLSFGVRSNIAERSTSNFAVETGGLGDHIVVTCTGLGAESACVSARIHAHCTLLQIQRLSYDRKNSDSTE